MHINCISNLLCYNVKRLMFLWLFSLQLFLFRDNGFMGDGPVRLKFAVGCDAECTSVCVCRLGCSEFRVATCRSTCMYISRFSSGFRVEFVLVGAEVCKPGGVTSVGT
jgi:hypothetical protein